MNNKAKGERQKAKEFKRKGGKAQSYFILKKEIFFFLLSLLIFPFTLSAELAVPALKSPVMDQANVLSIDNQLASALNDYWKKSGVQLAVLTVSDLQGESIEGYSMRVAEAWALGEKGKDKGALLLIAVNDHRVRIEVGYGLEEKLTDYQSGRIIRERITPHFRNNDYDSGVTAGVKAMASVINAPISGGRKAQRKSEAKGFLSPLISIFMMVMFLKLFRRNPMAALLLGSMMMGGGSRRGGGFGGGGFGGFSGGGGGFGGGGASGSW